MMRSAQARLSARDDNGAVAIFVAIMCVILFVLAALAVDVGNLVATKQALRNTIDAATLDGAAKLPDMAAAKAAVGLSLSKNDQKYSACGANPAAAGCPQPKFYCITGQVGSTPDLSSVAPPLGTSANTSDCKPGGVSGIGNYTTSCNGTKCSIQFIPGCTAPTCSTPDAMAVTDSKTVNFAFGPVIGKPTGQTGALTSAACKGSCGQDQPNPMNVMVVADRTPSMSTTDRNDMISGIKSMLNVMHPTLQYVSLATIGKAKPKTTLPVCNTQSASTFDQTGATWVTSPFTDQYQNTNNQMVADLNCMGQGYGGTDITSSLKAAARYLLGNDPNNLGSLPARTGTPRNAIIFETDGHPQIDNNKSPAYTGTTSLTNNGDIPYDAASTSGKVASCNAFSQVAANAKAAGVLIVTIGFGSAGTEDCDWTPGRADTLAAAASPTVAGPSTANYDCGTTAGRNSENSDGDYFFCAASGSASDLANIFVSAITQLSGTSHLLNLP